MSKLKKTLTVLFFLIIAGCAAPTKIASNKAADYNVEPKRIFVIADLGNQYSEDFYIAFVQKLKNIAEECSASLEASKASSLDLDPRIHLKKASENNADAVISIRPNGGTKDQYGNILRTVYDARMLDVKTNKFVWRADIDFARGGTLIPRPKRAEALAIEITNKMKEDHILNSCPLIKASM
jgi:hypothetical protein